MTTARLHNIPAELRVRNQWVLWKRVPGEHRTLKVPYAVNGAAADHSDPATWSTFRLTTDALARGERYDGVGFVFNASDPTTRALLTGPYVRNQQVPHPIPPCPYVAIDMDDILDAESRPRPGCEGVIARFAMSGAYVEVSPGGRGLHVISRGRCPGERHVRNGWPLPDTRVEIYDRHRYLTMTGRVFGAPIRGNIAWAQGDVDWLGHQLWDNEAEPAPIVTADVEAARLNTDDAVLERARAARNGHRFVALFDEVVLGPDRSSADFSACVLLSFWTGADPERVARLFQASALGQRDKVQRRADYALRTATAAVNFRLSRKLPFYDWRLDQGPALTLREAVERRHAAGNPIAIHPEAVDLLRGLGLSRERAREVIDEGVGTLWGTGGAGTRGNPSSLVPLTGSA